MRSEELNGRVVNGIRPKYRRCLNPLVSRSKCESEEAHSQQEHIDKYVRLLFENPEV